MYPEDSREMAGSVSYNIFSHSGFTLLKAMETELGGDAGNAGLFMLGMKLKVRQEK